MTGWLEEEKMLRQAKKYLHDQMGDDPEQVPGIAFRDSVTDLSFADNHPADLGSENFERSKDLSLREHHLERLRLVSEALNRIESGSYGTCLRCRSSIEPARLRALPEAPLCFACRQQEERGMLDPHRRPVEEERMLPPFAQRIVSGDPGLDQEDFWQEVSAHNKRSRVLEDPLDEEETGLVEETDSLTNRDLRDQLSD